MRKFILYLILLSPFLVCNPYQGADYFVVAGLPAAINASNIPPDPVGIVGAKLDLATLPVGSYTVTIQACSNYWQATSGGGCTPSSLPFVFSRPNLGQAPAGFGLSIK